MAKDWYKPGVWNAICDVCGFKRKSDQLIERWDGYMVCKPTVKQGCWETRHPQELIRPVPDQRKLPWTRPESTDIYWQNLDGYNSVINQCSHTGHFAQADYGEADCAEVGQVDGTLHDPV